MQLCLVPFGKATLSSTLRPLSLGEDLNPPVLWLLTQMPLAFHSLCVKPPRMSHVYSKLSLGMLGSIRRQYVVATGPLRGLRDALKKHKISPIYYRVSLPGKVTKITLVSACVIRGHYVIIRVQLTWDF